MIHTEPKVSVILPVYNSSRYLRLAINSILSQNLDDFELILVDDASTDSSWEIARSFTDTRLRCFRNSTNSGIAKTLNYALTHARGKYIGRMDADDISLPERLARQTQFLDTHPEVGLLGSGIRRMNDMGRVTARMWRYPKGNALLQWSLFHRCPFAHPTTMIRFSLIDKIGGYPIQSAEDYALWEQLSWRTELANLPEALLLLRKHKTNITYKSTIPLQQDSARISQQRIQKLLGINVDPEVTAFFFGKVFQNPNDYSVYSILLLRLYEAFVTKFNLTPVDNVQIRQDIGRLYIKAAFQQTLTPLQRGEAIQLAFRFDPAVLFRAARNKISLVKQ